MIDLVDAFCEGWTWARTESGAKTQLAVPTLLPDGLDEEDVWICRSITLSAKARARLVLPRVGPNAELFIDGESRLLMLSAFRPYELLVDLDVGTHELAICLRALAKFFAERRPRPRWKTRLVSQQQLRFLRAPLLGRMPSWSASHAPRGVLATPRLLPADRVLASDVFLRTHMDGDRGVVTIALPSWVTGRSVLRVGDVHAELTRSGDRLSATLHIDHPPRWWPRSHGTQDRLDATLTIDAQTLAFKVGFRTIERDPDPRFGLCINGVPIFCRGAVFVPPPSTLDFAPTRRALEALARAGGNMVRVGGTMRYEDAAFFDTCDELGLLVWQDFMFANMDYPIDDPAFAAEVAVEVDAQLHAWARHPSIAVLCGGSEVAQQAAMNGQPPERWYGPLFETLLPARCTAILPDVPYVLGSPSSPLDGDGVGAPPPLPFRVDRGVAHYYGVGAYLRPFEDARHARVTFASECLALSNVPEPAAVDALFGDDLPATHTPRWKMNVPRDNGSGWDFEDVRDHYLQQLFGTDALATRYADTDGYLERSRIVSAEVMTRVCSEWRSAGSNTRGALVWFLRDLAPGAGWGLLDADGEEKSPMHTLARVWSPTALLLTDEGVNGVRLHVVHDGDGERKLKLRVALCRSELVVAHAEREIVAPPRSAIAHEVEGLFGAFRDVGWAYRFGPRAHDVLLATLYDGETRVGEAAHVPVLEHPDAGLSAELTRIDDRYRVIVRATRLALYVAVRAPGWRAEASYFHMAPGESRTIELHARGEQATPRGAVHALGSVPARFS